MDEKMRWRPIETAPRDGTEIDLWVRKFEIGAGGETSSYNVGRYPNAWWGKQVEIYTGPYERREGDTEGWIHRDDLHFLLIEVSGYRATHWMPLAEPPQSERSGA